MMAQLNLMKNFYSTTDTPSEILKNLQIVVSNVKSAPILAGEMLKQLYHPKSSKLLERLLVTDNDEFVCCVLQGADEILKVLEEKDITATEIEVLGAIAETLFQLHFVTKKQLGPSKNQTLLLTASLSLLNKITTQCPNFAQTHLSELLGIAKAFVNFGLETNGLIIVPQKVSPTQNHFYGCSAEEQDDMECDGKIRRNGGGKKAKKRKPRALAKSLQNTQQQSQQQLQQQLHFQTLTLDHIVKDIKTSDSDASELENNVGYNGITRLSSTQERMRCAKIRLSAISLIGTIVTRLQERRLLYSYWHAFFENTKISNQTRRTDLLHIGWHDPNSRCRVTALQIAGQLIFSSKNFLQQAECNTDRLPMSFLPFAHNLGLQVVSMFTELTQILKAESSLPVLTQALKCLAVLVQATTPFQKFQPRDFVTDFVIELQRLVLHRDATIKVAALMVLEFLIAAPELTPEISNAIGATYQSICFYNKEDQANDLLEYSNIMDEHIGSDSDSETIGEMEVIVQKNQCSKSKNKCLVASDQTCWLLQCVLHNLGVYPNTTPSTTSIRIECLQVLASMSQHFSMLESHLTELAIGIQKAMLETPNDLRICAARCLDTVAYQIGRKLLENGKNQNAKECNQLERECLNFWIKLLPTIMAQIRSSSSDVSPSIKVCLCDAVSNIGVVIFEQQSHGAQMNLIGFLSGVASDTNEDATVRSACVRALAVYVLFPSLRGNLVFVENTAELTLRLIGDANMLVRVKASWALGNVTDALLINDSSDAVFEPERISVDLFWRLITAATESCNDNDKVRCNAVRTLGNLLRLFQPAYCKLQSNSNIDNQIIFRNALAKMIDCLRSAGSAKVKWNTCYAIGNFLQNTELFTIYQGNNFDWQSQLYSTLANIIVHHQNFKVRINAATALTRIATRAHFGAHYEMLWKALVSAIEQCHHLDNFYEYNHRDHLQEQLCLAMSHMIHCAQHDDFIILINHLKNSEISSNTWTRVVNRMVPEKSAPIVACTAFLQQQLKDANTNLTIEQCKAINSIIRLLKSQ